MQMALDKQIHIYSVDTSAFFTPQEQEIETDRLQSIYKKSKLKSENKFITKYLEHSITEKSAIRKIKDVYKDRHYDVVLSEDKISENCKQIKELNKFISQKKSELLELLSTHQGIRKLNPAHLVDKNVVSVFESGLTRTLGLEPNHLYEDIIIVQTYYYDVIKDIVIDGFIHNEELDTCLTASAGQIRTKKTVFISEQLWKQHENTLLCGLILDKINALGGVNVNKYLAYLALCNSATDLWSDFDIDRCIVVDDMETLVNGMVDYIDPETYNITRQRMDVPINQTDGCGMMLPRVSKRNFMIRLPWVKGLLATFDFRRFIEQYGGSTEIVDIYGKSYDIIADNIQIIFTKSQFKMWKYYKDWSDYKALFKLHGCTAGKCNVEETQFDYAKLNYQMLQTLSDMTDDELSCVAQQTKDKLRLMATDRNTMLKIFKATPYNANKNAFQESLMVYPELLQDNYSKETLRDIKKSLQNDAWAAKLDINGIYTFIVPDLFAFCQWLFLGDKNPVGLLQDGEVSCNLFPAADKLDCLRSPHLYIEHSIRKNLFTKDIEKWFTTKALYVSIHDLISKILQFDVDGDKSLVCADPTIISVAERNTQKYNVVPLYYEMKKADSTLIDKAKIYDGLNAAYKGGRIGEISNLITKIWNSDDINLDAIKWLCLETNFTIDFAKTLYKPTRPQHVHEIISKYSKKKTPHFFQYAKQKSPTQVEGMNDSCVNRLKNIIPNQRFQFNASRLGKFNYKVLMSNPKVDVNTDLAQSIIEKFFTLSRDAGSKINTQDDGHNNFEYIYGLIRFNMAQLCGDRQYVVDVLVKQLFHIRQSKRKALFWGCYGDIVVENLKRNLNGTIMCEECGKRVAQTNNRIKYCNECAKRIDNKKRLERYYIHKNKNVSDLENHSKSASQANLAQ